jgi:Sulfotransferase family
VPEGLKVFILGPARSGTSVMYYALQKIVGLPGDGESHVVPGFQRVIYTFARYCEQFGEADGVLARRLDPGQFRSHVIGYLRDFYDRTYTDGNFVDKTPGAEAIAGVPLIQEAFPHARVIVTRRTGIEVVQSHVRKFGVNFVDACRAWSASMEALRRARFAATNLLEIEQHELANAPGIVSDKIATCLERPDKAGELAAFFCNSSIDRHSDHDWSRRLLLADVPWTDEEKRMFSEICGRQMDEFGYPA